MRPNDVNDIWMNKVKKSTSSEAGPKGKFAKGKWQLGQNLGGNVAQEPPACCEWKFLPTQLCKGRMIKKHILPVKALQR